MIGDDIESFSQGVQERSSHHLRENRRIFGNSYEGYELFFKAVIDQLLTKQPIKKRLLSLFGVVPYQHIWWKGNLKAPVLRQLILDHNYAGYRGGLTLMEYVVSKCCGPL